MTPGPTLLVAEGLTAGYGRFDILHDVSLRVGVNEIVSIIGPNGAGKSTAFKTVVGFLTPRTGRVLFNGEEITGLRPDRVLRRGLAYVPQGRIVFPQMTVLAPTTVISAATAATTSRPVPGRGLIASASSISSSWTAATSHLMHLAGNRRRSIPRW